MGLIRVFGSACIKDHRSGYKLFNKISRCLKSTQMETAKAGRMAQNKMVSVWRRWPAYAIYGARF